VKILLIDDHVVVRAGVGRLLATEVGATIFEAQSSQQALEVWRQEQPDLVILDLNLEGSSGLDLLRRLMLVNKSVNSRAQYAL
jgi:two-component system, NarL family, invasion response regulator UvrY